MTVPAGMVKAFADFPAALRKLVESELAAGNAITELSGGFPAPPVGAYIKLANKVSTQPRESSEALDFYERNGSSHSGEFTDAQRFFFVLEPANPTEPEPDMDAVRKALEVRQNTSNIVYDDESVADDTTPRSRMQNASRQRTDATNAIQSDKALTITATDAGWTRVLHFRDHRAPHEVQFALEGKLRSLFTPVSTDDGSWCVQTPVMVVGTLYTLELRLEAALDAENAYSLRVETSWKGTSAANLDYYRKSSVGWFAWWTRDFTPANPPSTNAGSRTRYLELAAAAFSAEASLDSVAAIQHVIVSAMKRGASFGASDKEGDTKIFWKADRFRRSDDGDNPDYRIFNNEAEFLNALHMFFGATTRGNAGANTPSEVDEWKLILRQLRT